MLTWPHCRANEVQELHYKDGNDTVVYPKQALQLRVTVDVHHAHVEIQLARCLDPQSLHPQSSVVMHNGGEFCCTTE